MAVQSKAEINLRRLLAQCETMANEIKSNDGRINWRLEKVSYPFIIKETTYNLTKGLRSKRRVSACLLKLFLR